MHRLLFLFVTLFYPFTITAQNAVVNVEESLFEMAIDALNKREYQRARTLLHSANENGYFADSIIRYEKKIDYLLLNENRLKNAVRLFGSGRFQDAKDAFDSIPLDFCIDTLFVNIRSECGKRVADINQGRALSRELAQFMNINKEWVKINPYYATAFCNGYFKCKMNGTPCFLSKKGFVIPRLNAKEIFNDSLFVVCDHRINEHYYGPEYLGTYSSSAYFTTYNELMKTLLFRWSNNTDSIYIPHSKDRYDFVRPNVNGLAKVRSIRSKQIGYINSKGELVVECKYEDGGDYSNGLIKVYNAGKWGYIDSLGNQIIDYKYKYCEDFSEGLAVVKEGNKYGYIDKKGEWQIKPIYDGSWSFNNGLAAVRIKDKWFFINHLGQNVFNQYFPEIGSSSRFDHGFSEGYACVRIYFEENGKTLESKWGFIDSTGNRLTPFIYDDVGSFHNGMAVIARDGYRYGYIDSTGKEFVPPIYEKAYDFNDNFGLIEKDGYYGFIDKYGVTTFDLIK